MDRGRRGWSRLAVLLGLVALLVTACSSAIAGQPAPAAIPPLSAAESINQSLLDLGEAGVVHYKGTLTTASDQKVTFDVSVSAAGDVLGSITVDGSPATILTINKALYVKAPAKFWTALRGIGESDGKGTAIADRWVKLPAVLLGMEFGEMFEPDGLSQGLAKEPKTAGEGALSERPKTTESGAEMIKIPLDIGAVFLAAKPPYGVAKLTLSRLGATDNTRVKDLVADLTDASAQTVKFYQDVANQAAGLTTAVDALTTVEQGNHRFDQCGASSCSLIVEFTNTAKVPVRVHLKADWTGDNAPLGSCEIEVGPVAPGQGDSATCTLATPEWVNFWQRAHSVVGQHPYGATWAPLVLADAPDLGAVTTQASAKPADPKNRKTEGTHYVYSITYADKVWKYGVAGTKYWRDQATQQLRPCLATNRAVCSFSLVTATDNAASAYALQQQLVASNPGGCPAGQWVSCKR